MLVAEMDTGDVVGDYEIVGVLGKGGMGRVFRVRNLISGREEAMKVVLPDLESDVEFTERFLREIKLHATLEHRNIAALRTALRVDNRILMVMELVEGLSLEEKLRQGPLAAVQAVEYTIQVLAALEYAHARGVIHRDIKPANIIVAPDGAVKLTDFGIARAAGDRALTRTGLALGSLYYMSPEQIKAQPTDARSDLYSVGVTLYEMVTGKRPLRGDSEYAIMNAHLVEIPTPPEELNPSLPPDVSAAILKALAKDPRERFQTAAEFTSALNRQSISAAPMIPTVRTVSATQPLAGREYLARWDPQVLDAARQKLAIYIGPIAKVLVDRAARRTHTPHELYAALATELGSESDRKSFLASLKA